jgi:hypothetical protein
MCSLTALEPRSRAVARWPASLCLCRYRGRRTRRGDGTYRSFQGRRPSPSPAASPQSSHQGRRDQAPIRVGRHDAAKRRAARPRQHRWPIPIPATNSAAMPTSAFCGTAAWPDPWAARGHWRQHRDGVVLRLAAREPPRPPLGEPRPKAAGDHHLDRAHRPPAPSPRQANPAEYQILCTQVTLAA